MPFAAGFRRVVPGLRIGLVCAIGAVAVGAPGAAPNDIAQRPEQLKYPPLKYDVPKASDYRIKLPNGMVAYLVPDHTLPLVTVSALMRVGPDLDPPGKEGLADMTLRLLTRSGTKTRSAKQIEDRVAFLGAQLGSGMGGGGFFGSAPPDPNATINLLSKDLDEGLALLTECLKTPGWETERIKLDKDQILQSMKERNDNSASIEEREWGFLMRGDGHWSNRYPTAASIESLTPEDLAAFHKRYIGPKNFILAVSGDFDRTVMTKRLTQAFSDWPQPGEHPGPPSAPSTPSAAGWYLVDKDVNQGRVSIGVRALDRYDKDYFPARIMNDILGGSTFTSRLGNRIRSDEGLAYQVNSRLEGGTYYPDPWRLVFQSKVRSVAYAVQLARREIQKMRDSVVTPEELEVAKNRSIEGFPSFFETAQSIANALASEEVTGRYQKDPNYFTEFRDRVRAVTADDIQRVARRLLDPSKMTVLMVGNAKDILLGDPKYDAKITAMATGEPKRIPLRDPMTMKPMPTP